MLNSYKRNNNNKHKESKNSEQKFQDNILTVDSKGFIQSAQKYNHLKNRNVFDFILFEEFVSIFTLKKEIPLLTPTAICCICHSTDFLYPVNAEITKINDDLFLIKVVYGKRKDFEYRYKRCE